MNELLDELKTIEGLVKCMIKDLERQKSAEGYWLCIYPYKRKIHKCTACNTILEEIIDTGKRDEKGLPILETKNVDCFLNSWRYCPNCGAHMNGLKAGRKIIANEQKETRNNDRF